MNEPRDDMGRTKLTLAVIDRDQEAVNNLLKSGHSANGRDRKRWTPLHHAAKSGDESILRNLIDHAGDVNSQNIRQMTPLMVASRFRIAQAHHRLNIVKILLETCDLTGPTDRKNRTHLHYAATSGQDGIFQLVFEMWDKNNLLVLDKYQQSVLYMAVTGHSLNMVATLLNQDVKTVHTLLNIPAKNRLLPIHRAAKLNNLPVFRSLVEHGQDVNVKGGLSYLPLLCAAESCAPNVLDYLLSLPSCDINATVLHNETALFRTVVACFNFSRTNARKRNPAKPRPFHTVIFKLLQANVDCRITSTYGIFRTKKHERAQDALAIAVKGGLEAVVQMVTYTGCSLGSLAVDLQKTDDQLSKYLALNMGLVNWLREYHTTPGTLKVQCRSRIREVLGQKFRFSVHALKLPKPLLDYLRLTDLQHYCEHEETEVLRQNDISERLSDFEYENSVYDSNEHLDSLASLDD